VTDRTESKEMTDSEKHLQRKSKLHILKAFAQQKQMVTLYSTTSKSNAGAKKIHSWYVKVARQRAIGKWPS
jgi:hypothetical protein